MHFFLVLIYLGLLRKNERKVNRKNWYSKKRKKNKICILTNKQTAICPNENIIIHTKKNIDYYKNERKNYIHCNGKCVCVNGNRFFGIWFQKRNEIPNERIRFFCWCFRSDYYQMMMTNTTLQTTNNKRKKQQQQQEKRTIQE